jgi:trehalose/maltose transport system substrate-binding protein
VTDATGSGGWHGVRKQRSTGGRKRAGFAVAALVAAGTLACGGGGESGTPTLNWYINPDNGGQEELARKCSEASDGAYRIETQVLPNDASSQREQLVRRLAANDSGIDLMSLDPVFVAEFAEAGFLHPLSEDQAATFTEDVLDGPVESATWEDKLVAAPFWANTQLL